jgi:hypothetical protein
LQPWWPWDASMGSSKYATPKRSERRGFHSCATAASLPAHGQLGKSTLLGARCILLALALLVLANPSNQAGTLLTQPHGASFAAQSPGALVQCRQNHASCAVLLHLQKRRLAALQLRDLPVLSRLLSLRVGLFSAAFSGLPGSHASSKSDDKQGDIRFRCMQK